MQTDFISPSKSELSRSKQNDRTIVLVVDDSQDTLTMLTDVLTFENLEVLTAKDGPRAIQLANLPQKIGRKFKESDVDKIISKLPE